METPKSKIFFSYGHDCSQMVTRLKEDLVSQGYEVWLDTECIHPGQDWREEITKAILHADLVFAFFSKYSLREDSICRNELAIAVGYKLEKIRTFLMEPDAAKLIPTVLSTIQYFDLCEENRLLGENSAGFESSYGTKLQELVAILDSPESVEMDVQLCYLRKVLCADSISPRHAEELRKNYIKRELIQEKVQRWEDFPESPCFLLYGGPGSGKSSFAAHYYHFDKDVSGTVLCEYGSKRADAVVKALAFQMACRHPTYRRRLSYLLERQGNMLADFSLHELCEFLFVKAAQNDIQEHFDHIVIVIDGIDQLNQEGDNELAEAITSLRNLIPSYLRILITSRNDTIVKRYFSNYDYLQIEDYKSQNEKEVRDYFEVELRNELSKYPPYKQNIILNSLAHRAEGSFIYAELFCIAIRKYHLSLENPDQYPKGLESIYFLWFRHMFPSQDEYEEKYLPLLSILAAAREPVPISTIGNALGLKKRELRNSLRRISAFLIERTDIFDESTVTLFHPSVSEWLLSDEADIYEIDEEEGADYICQLIEDEYSNGDLSYYATETFMYWFTIAKKKAPLEKMLNDESVFVKRLQLAKRYEESPVGSQNALSIYQQLHKQLSSITSSLSGEMVEELKASVYEGLADCTFALGYYKEMCSILEDATVWNPKSHSDAANMRRLNLLGTVYDWQGRRAASLSAFNELMSLALSTNDAHYIASAQVGLIWNEHFNDIAAATTAVEQNMDKYDSDERIALQLCRARVLLSSGDVVAALSLFEQTLNSFQFTNAKDYHVYRKNVLLLMEILPACYDNEEYRKGIELGERIVLYAKGRTWLEECYLFSWLAILNLQLGDFQLAKRYMYQADAMNRDADSIKQSDWLDMHLTSIRSFIAYETGDINNALAGHIQVRSMASQCNDSWVLGDACFEICKIAQLFGLECSILSDAYNELLSLANTTGLPHLKCKAVLIGSLQDEQQGKSADEILSMLGPFSSIDFRLASINRLEINHLTRKVLFSHGAANTDNIDSRIHRVYDEIITKNNMNSEDKARFRCKTTVQRLISEEVL